MRISIITPVFNRSDCVLRCLESVTDQLKELGGIIDIEHVVVDDGSTDATAAVLNVYAAEHPHVKTIVFDSNRGVNAARNAAIKASTGTWCLFLDSDDFLAEGSLKTIARIVMKNGGYQSYMFAVDDRAEELTERYGNGCVFAFEDFLLKRVKGDFAHLLDRGLLMKYPFNEELRIFEDIFFLQLYRETKEMLFTNVVTHIRDRGRMDSVSLTFVRYNDAIIKRKLLAAVVSLQLFENDYMRCGHTDIVERLHFDIADNALLLGDYVTAKQHLLSAGNSVMAVMLRAIVSMRLRKIYKLLLQGYISFKHKRPERGVS